MNEKKINGQSKEFVVQFPGQLPQIISEEKAKSIDFSKNAGRIIGSAVDMGTVEKKVRAQIRQLEIDSWYNRLKVMSDWVETEFKLLELVILVESGTATRPSDMGLDRWNNFITRHQRLINYYRVAMQLRQKYLTDQKAFETELQRMFPEFA